MKHHLTVDEYFKSISSGMRADGPRPSAPFVTIAREAGAGGHELAEALLARFSQEADPLFSGWKIFDRDLCERVAMDPDLHVSLEALLDEEFHTGFDDFLRSVLDLGSQIKIDHRMFKTVRGVCSLGKAIVIGRAGALIARDLPLGAHVRLVSALGARIQRAGRAAGLDAAAARKLLEQKDERRARMVDAHFNRDIADPLLYDCVWNADTVSYEAMADSLVALIRWRADREPLAASTASARV